MYNNLWGLKVKNGSYSGIKEEEFLCRENIKGIIFAMNGKKIWNSYWNHK